MAPTSTSNGTSSPTVQVTSLHDGKVCAITLNRPEKLNSFTREMGAALYTALHAAAQNDSSRAVLLSAQGKGFCAGQDLSEVIPQNGSEQRGSEQGGSDSRSTTPLDLGEIVRDIYNPIIELICSMPKPVVCLVNGVAAGAGANLALACDIVIAAASASFIQAFSKVGLIPDSGGTFMLPRLLGLNRAKALALLGEKVSAAQMKEYGAIYSVVPDAELIATGQALAAQLADGPTLSYALTKELMNSSISATLSEQLAKEERAQRACGFSNDYQAAVTAFVNRSSVAFSGK